MHTHMQDSSAKPLGLESPAVHTHTQQEGSGIRADPPTAGGVLPAGAVGAAGEAVWAAAWLEVGGRMLQLTGGSFIGAAAGA